MNTSSAEVGTSPIGTAIGAEMRRLRTGLGWRREEVAEKLGVTENYVGMLERGERVPGIEILVKIADRMGTTISALLGERGDDPWTCEALALLHSIPEQARAPALAMLRGLVSMRATPGTSSGEEVGPEPVAPPERSLVGKIDGDVVVKVSMGVREFLDMAPVRRQPTLIRAAQKQAKYLARKEVGRLTPEEASAVNHLAQSIVLEKFPKERP